MVRTTRNDLVIGTSKGMLFVQCTPNGELIATREPVVLPDKDITELSEYDVDQFIIGLWNENNYILVDRLQLQAKP